MKNNDYWKRFEQTGAILDYLNYTACTSESANRNIANEIYTGSNGEGEVRGCSEYDWDGAFVNASRRL